MASFLLLLVIAGRGIILPTLFVISVIIIGIIVWIAPQLLHWLVGRRRHYVRQFPRECQGRRLPQATVGFIIFDFD